MIDISAALPFVSTGWKIAGGVVVLLAIWVIVSMIVTKGDDARKAAADGAGGSKFPVADGSGHLICRSCGAASEDKTVDDVHRFYASANRFQMFLVPCPKCGVPSVYDERELKGWSATA